jgi:mannitol/fructose-specific phosphotransferase system IIA component (Ntr-type)|tara:strand:- start:228887 stop:229360 length:474 start_codon:yes stop_codon:yes gene_type:complete
MQLNKDVTLDYALYGLKSKNKRECMRDIARFICKHNTTLNEIDLFDQLLDQERQATSGIGHSIAIPHIRMNELKKPLNIIAHLESPVDFDSADGEDVRIIWVTLSPRSDGTRHLMRLAKISRMLSDPALSGQLTKARSLDELRAILLNVDDDMRKAA